MHVRLLFVHQTPIVHGLLLIILQVGLDAAGKTTILYKLHIGEVRERESMMYVCVKHQGFCRTLLNGRVGVGGKRVSTCGKGGKCVQGTNMQGNAQPPPPQMQAACMQ